MDLTIKDLASMCKISEKTVYRWIKAGKIPCYRLNHQFRFRREEINEWMLKNKMLAKAPSAPAKPASLLDHLKNGGFFYKIPGDNPEKVIRNSVEIIPYPPEIDKGTLTSLLLQREKMMPTAIGNGIAIPHPRNPIAGSIVNESVSICCLHSPVDFKGLDKTPVHTLFILISAEISRHLQILSQISFICQDDHIIGLLKQQALRNEVLDAITQKLKNAKL